MTTHKLAVYGTLKQGHGNHFILGKDAKFLGAGQTKENYSMPEFGPVVFKAPNQHPVQVELYEVTEEQLKGPLDSLEANGSYYNREIIPIQLDSGEEHDAWLYLCPATKNDSGFKKPNENGRLSYGGYRRAS